MKKTISYSLFILSVFSCTENNKKMSDDFKTPSTQDKVKDSAGVPPESIELQTQDSQKYKGVLPCASCEGIETELTLFNDSYELKEVYIGEGAAPKVEKGKLAIERGFENDNDATLYILNPGNSVFRQYYVRLTSNSNDNVELIKLDKDMKRIESRLNYSLKKIDK